jgi:hypothetical protein
MQPAKGRYDAVGIRGVPCATMRRVIADVLRAVADLLEPRRRPSSRTTDTAFGVYLGGWDEAPDGVFYCRECGRELGSGHESRCRIGAAERAIGERDWAGR